MSELVRRQVRERIAILTIDNSPVNALARAPCGSRKGIPDPLVEQIAEEEAAKRGVTRRNVGADETVGRTMTAVIDEGARILEKGFAAQARDIDLIYCDGFGSPRHRGWPMFLR